MTPEENAQQESLKKQTEGQDAAARSAKRLLDALEDLEDPVKRQARINADINRSFLGLDRAIKSGRKRWVDASEDVARLAEEIEELTDTTEKRARQEQLAEARDRVATATRNKFLVDSFATLAKGLATAGFSITKSLVGSYQSGASTYQMAGDAALAGIEATFGTMEQLAKGAQIAGSALSLIPGWTKALGIALTAVGAVTELVIGNLTGAAKEALQIGFKELDALAKSYGTATAAGALFANGMTEFRATAGDANLTQTEFAKILAENNTTFAMYGGSVAKGAQKFAEINKAMSVNRGELLALGYSFEDMASGVATVMDLQYQQGLAGKMNADEVAKATTGYLTNLRAISALTGEDVKRAQARAKEAATQSAVDAKLRRMDPEARQRFINSIMTLAPEAQKAAMQKFVTGTITDPDLAVAFANNVDAMTQLDRAVGYVNDSSISAGDVVTKMSADMKELGPGILKSADAMGDSLGVVNLLTGQFSGLEKIIESQQAVGKRQIADTEDEAKKTANTTDALTKSYADASVAAQQLKIDIQKTLTPAITGLASVLNTERDKILEAVSKLTEHMSGGGGGGKGYNGPGSNVPPTAAGAGARGGGGPQFKIGRGEGETPDLTALLANPAFAGLVTTSKNDGEHVAGSKHYEGKAADFSVRGLSPEEVVKKLTAIKNIDPAKINVWGEDKSADTDWAKSIVGAGGNVKGVGIASAPHIHMELMAKGGITDGLSLAGEAGPEAVIPLPDGRTVPVKMDTGELVSKMNELITVMKDNRDYSEKILHATQ
jgi:hypothetical protein